MNSKTSGRGMCIAKTGGQHQDLAESSQEIVQNFPLIKLFWTACVLLARLSSGLVAYSVLASHELLLLLFLRPRKEGDESFSFQRNLELKRELL
jgi:hypothetical protein